MNVEKNIKFTAAIRGYHFDKRYWQPKEAERLECLHEIDNPFNVFAIKTVNSDKVITGHLPCKISGVTKFLLDRGATAYAELTLTHYQRLPIMQGRLEIPCKITIKLHGTVKNQMLLDQYMQLGKSLYCGPKEEVIMGLFLTKTQLLALLTASKFATSSVKKQLNKRQEKMAIME